MRALAFRRRHRRERAAILVPHVPPAGLQLLKGANSGINGFAAAIQVKPFSIDAHRGCHDEAAHRPVDQRLQQGGGAEVVDGGVLVHLVHALADANHRCQMEHLVDAGNSLPHLVRIANITTDHLDITRQIVGNLAVIPMHLGDEAVENTDPVAITEQFICKVRSDKAGTSRNQNLSRHPASRSMKPSRSIPTVATQTSRFFRSDQAVCARRPSVPCVSRAPLGIFIGRLPRPAKVAEGQHALRTRRYRCCYPTHLVR